MVSFCRHPTTVSLSTGQQPQQVRAEIVSGSYFTVLGVQPRLGRLIDASDDVNPGGHPVVVVGESYWHNQLGERSERDRPQGLGQRLSDDGDWRRAGRLCRDGSAVAGRRCGCRRRWPRRPATSMRTGTSC